MTIALDATYSLDRAPSGVALYAREILHGLAAAHPETRFRFCYRPHRFLRSFGAPIPPNARRALLAERWGPRADLFHGLNQRLPNRRMHRAVATFHDLFALTGDYSTPDFRARFALQARDAAQRADAIIAVSEFTKRQVVDLLGVAAAKVRVIHHGARPLGFPVRAREKVVLNVGALQRRKNIVRLVEAFEALDADWRLVLAGSAGYAAEEIAARIEASPARARIVRLGYASDADLSECYARASIFAFPSLDEGFGMPLLEAMSVGVAIITSNRSALPEVAGDAALLVDPEDSGALREALVRLARDPELRESLIAKGQSRIGLFRWENAVRQTWELYRELLG